MGRRSSAEILGELKEILTSPPEQTLTPYQEKFLDDFQKKLERDIFLINPRLTNARKFIAKAVVGLQMNESYPRLVDILEEIGLPGKSKRS